MTNSTKLTWLLVSCLTTLGCGADVTFEIVPVDGIVTLEGQPIDEAQVVFHPVDPTAAPVNRPVGITDTAGHFRLTTLSANDGAAIGTYKITISWQERMMVGEESTRSGKSLISAVYTDPVRTPLEHTVSADQPQRLKLELFKKPPVAPK